MPNYNTKDVFIQRRTQTGTFEEHPLVVQPNSLIVTDPLNNLIMVDTSSFLAGTGSITQAISSSYSNYAVTSSYALNVPATASLALLAQTASHLDPASNIYFQSLIFRVNPVNHKYPYNYQKSPNKDTNY